jgi:hypothetical protein
MSETALRMKAASSTTTTEMGLFMGSRDFALTFSKRGR